MILVTGATGHSGSWFIKKLAETGYSEKIRCAVRNQSNCEALERSGLNIEYVKGDLENPHFVEESLKGIKTVAHFASINFSKNIIKSCKTNNVQWAILVHTTGRYSKFKSAASRYIEIEEWISKSEVNHSIIRPTMIYGSHRDKNLWKLISFMHKFKFFPVFGNGKNLNLYIKFINFHRFLSLWLP